MLISNIAFIIFTSACCILSGKKVSQNNFPFFQRYLIFDLFFVSLIHIFHGINECNRTTAILSEWMNSRWSHIQCVTNPSWYCTERQYGRLYFVVLGKIAPKTRVCMLFKKKNTTNHILLYTLGYKKIINTNNRHAANVQHTQNFWNDTKERNNITIRYLINIWISWTSLNW